MALTDQRQPGLGEGMRFPVADAYFAQLPDGWASFPTCLARASLLDGLRGRGVLDILEALPASLRPLLDHVARDVEWVPEVVHVATLLAVRDARFGEGPGEDDAFLAWMTQLNRDLLGGPDLAALIVPPNPDEIVPRLPALWESFHAGTPLTVAERSATHARLVLAHPRSLFHAYNLESHRRTLALSLAKAGAVQPVVAQRTELSGDDARTMFEASWH